MFIEANWFNQIDQVFSMHTSAPCILQCSTLSPSIFKNNCTLQDNLVYKWLWLWDFQVLHLVKEYLNSWFLIAQSPDSKFISMFIYAYLLNDLDGLQFSPSLKLHNWNDLMMTFELLRERCWLWSSALRGKLPLTTPPSAVITAWLQLLAWVRLGLG